MGELVLVRHAQASFGAPNYDKLSPLGHRQTQWLGEYFRAHQIDFHHVVRGDLMRHAETAAGIADHLTETPMTVDPRLNEFDYDPIQEEYLIKTGTAAPTAGREAFLEMFPQMFEAWANGDVRAGSESFREFSDRVEAGLNAAMEPERSVLVVTSGGVIGVALMRLLGLNAAVAGELLLNIHNASVHRIALEAGKPRLMLFNASPHLDPPDRAPHRTYI